jgi:hypothetical protein
MDWFHPETVMLCVLLLFFLLRKMWKLAFAVLTFIITASIFASFLETRYTENQSATDLGISFLLISGCIWFSIYALIGLLEGRKK